MQILKSDLLKDENQIILVFTKNTNAKVYLCEKVNNTWETILETEGYVGKNGLGKEKEGDLKTPVGLFDLGISFGLHENIKTELDYYVLNENMYWICDSNSKYYNEFMYLNECIGDKPAGDKNNETARVAVENTGEQNKKNVTIKDWNDTETEHLIDENIAYEYAIEIKYNKENLKEKGSAIFLHCIKDGPTAGCVAIPTDKMKFILEYIKKDTKVYIDYDI